LGQSGEVSDIIFPLSAFSLSRTSALREREQSSVMSEA